MAKLDEAGDWAERRLEALEREEAENAERLRQLHREIAALEAAPETLVNRQLRAQFFDATKGICPRCFIDDDRRVEMVNDHNAAPLGDGRDPMKCPSCGYEDTSTP